MADFQIKAGARSPAFIAALSYSDGTMPNLAGATAVLQFRRLRCGFPILEIANAFLAIDDIAKTVSYGWVGATLDVPGDYLASVLVTLSGDTEPTHFPEVPAYQPFITVEVLETLELSAAA